MVVFLQITAEKLLDAQRVKQRIAAAGFFLIPQTFGNQHQMPTLVGPVHQLFDRVGARWETTVFHTQLGQYPASFDDFDAVLLTGSRADSFSDAPWVVELRKQVTSPGGTTAAALDVLMAPGGMQDLMRKAVEAGREAYLAGRMPRKLYATASSPIDGVAFR